MDEKQVPPLEDTMTEQEMTNMTAALKDPEFRKLLAEYCSEMSDPANQALYEQELTQYEAERGIDLTFITPEPGFVIKTVVDGREKAFINVSRNGKVERPTSRYACDAHGQRGLQWSIPLTQAPPRLDYDNRKQKCTVYDVVFHPDTLHLAARNQEFRRLVISTACDAVESAFQVSLDRVNVRFPKLTFKGTPRPTVIRKRATTRTTTSSSSEGDESGCSLADHLCPGVNMANLNGDRAPIVIGGGDAEVGDHSQFAVPTYKLVHRMGVDMHEMTHERDAKLNAAVPKELVVTVDLPLLRTSQHVKLDVRGRSFQLVCEIGQRYRLDLTLPYAVLEQSGRAQFDGERRQLAVTLPVDRAAVDLQLSDLTRVLTKQASDSGVDSPSSHSHSSEDDDLGSYTGVAGVEASFLDRNTAYTLPTFATNLLDNDVVFTLNVKGVDPASVQVRLDEAQQAVHVKFFSLGSGYAPSHFAFYAQFAPATVLGHLAEAWDNNVVLQVELSAVPEQFAFGRSEAEELEQGLLRGTRLSDKTDALGKNEVKEQVREDTADSTGAREEDDVFHDVVGEEKAATTTTTRAGKKERQHKQKDKKKRKGRSLSESDLKHHEQPAGDALRPEEGEVGQVAPTPQNHGLASAVRKARSVSESGGGILDANGNFFHFKGILKRRPLDRSVSESCSSVDDAAGGGGSMAVSFDMGVGSFGDIPEEADDDSDHPVGSDKKQVTFNEVIRKQLFR